MRPTARLLVIFVSSLLFVPAIFAQTNPPPSDPHEFVTHEPRLLTSDNDRGAAIGMLADARAKSDLHDVTGPYALRVSFQTNGTTLLEGKGTFDEVAEGDSRRWTAKVGDWQITRISNGPHTYSTNPTEPLPLRIQTIRSLLQSPIPANPEANTMRQATVKREGMTLSCVLGSGSIGWNAAPRAWTESEFCVDTTTNLLQMWSPTPGVFAVYDYSGATDFHGRIFPRQISIYQEGRLAVHLQVDRLEDLPELDPNLLTPTQEMMDAGETFALGMPNRFPLRVDPIDAPTSSYFQPVIVHAILDPNDGTVLDAEPIQNYDPELTRAAMDLITNSAFPPMGFQRDVFINVQFHLPAGSGPKVIRMGVHVRWRILDREVRVAPPRKPRRVGK